MEPWLRPSEEQEDEVSLSQKIDSCRKSVSTGNLDKPLVLRYLQHNIEFVIFVEWRTLMLVSLPCVHCVC